MATTQDKQFFNLHVNGIGYLNRVRWVTPSNRGGRRAEPFLACSIAALRGSTDEPAYTYLDLRVSGEEAIQVIGNLQKDVDEERKVIVSFRVGDIYPHLYERNVRERGRPTGDKEMATLIKGRLLLINTVKVNGELVYTREKDEVAEHDGASGDEGSDAPERAESQREPEPQRARSAFRAPESERETRLQRRASDQSKLRPALRARNEYEEMTA